MNGDLLKNVPLEQSKEFHKMSLGEKIRDQICKGIEPFFSVEFFPPRSINGFGSFMKLLNLYAELSPLFCDITWHLAGKPESDELTSAVVISDIVLNTRHLETMLHLTCVGMTNQQILSQLNRAKNLGIRNILALRGDLNGKLYFFLFPY